MNAASPSTVASGGTHHRSVRNVRSAILARPRPNTPVPESVAERVASSLTADCLADLPRGTSSLPPASNVMLSTIRHLSYGLSRVSGISTRLDSYDLRHI